jgi:epoxyqueuosine reductase
MGGPRTVSASAPRLEALIAAQSYGLGFDLVGIARLGPVETAAAFDEWIAQGYAGEMHYLNRGAAKRRDSRLPAPGTVSAIVVAMNYGGREPSGPIARYARGDDYHDVIRRKLDDLHGWLNAAAPRAVRGKAYVDTGPLLERDLARRAGLGWFGKNTNLIHPALGSFFFLGALLVDLDLEPSAPFEADRCGTCTRCIDACPTNAFVAPHIMDATRCVSYLTIELRDAIPAALREGVGELIYGCDICQSVCPWNVRFAKELREPALQAREALANKDARTLSREILAMDENQFRAQFRNSPMQRTKRRGLARNAAVVLGNAGDESDVPALVRALDHDERLVREHAAWALHQIRTRRRTAT